MDVTELRELHRETVERKEGLQHRKRAMRRMLKMTTLSEVSNITEQEAQEIKQLLLEEIKRYDNEIRRHDKVMKSLEERLRKLGFSL